MNPSTVTHLVLDAHVHLYECFDLQTLLDAARTNFQQVIEQRGLPASSTRFCFLCVDLQDRRLDDTLQRLAKLPDYKISTVDEDEPYSRHIKHIPSNLQWQIVWGHQIICKENLEVLAFGLPEPLPNGTSLEAVLGALQSAVFGILPWGFGKWSGSRGELVSQLMSRSRTSDNGDGWWVGDNGGRLALAHRPKQITKAVKVGRWNIPGSDPLPFQDQASKVGSCGVILQGDYHADAPAASIRRLLDAATTQPEVFGGGERLARFVRAQFGMQWRKRFA